MFKRVREETSKCMICEEMDYEKYLCICFGSEVHDKCCELWRSVTPMLRAVAKILSANSFTQDKREEAIFSMAIEKTRALVLPSTTIAKSYEKLEYSGLLDKINGVVIPYVIKHIYPRLKHPKERDVREEALIFQKEISKS